MFEVQALAKCLQISPEFGSKILDNCFRSWCRKMWNNNVQHTLIYRGLCYVPLPPFIHIPLFIQCLYVTMLLSSAKRVLIYSPFWSFIMPIHETGALFLMIIFPNGQSS